MASKKGHIVSEETRKKISNSLRNEKHFNWKEKPTYGIVHYWLRKNFERPKICQFCGLYKFCEWALIHGKKYERNRENFVALCRKCHTRYDWKTELRLSRLKCIDCGVQLKDPHAKRCQAHAQKRRFLLLRQASGSPVYH
jgi:hypothetical protein